MDIIDQFLTQDYWQYEWWGNTVYDYALALMLFLVSALILKLFQLYLIRKLKSLAEKTQTDLDDTAIAVAESLKPAFYFIVSVYLGVRFLSLHPIISQVLNAVIVITLVYQAINAVQIIVDYAFKKRMSAEEEESARSIINLVNMITKVVLWGVGILFVLSNLGVNVLSLVTGLGIGGLAVALAMQNILGDLFSSLSIFLDKPFAVGDFIVVGDTAKGTVERIGIKTTRLRSLQGEELVVANTELTTARIWNYKRMQERRIAFKFGVLYETPIEKLREITQMVEDIVKGLDGVRFDRAFFNRFDDSALGFEVVYYVLSDDYVDYLKAQQEINLSILELFEREGIEMAYPTQTVHLAKNE